MANQSIINSIFCVYFLIQVGIICYIPKLVSNDTMTNETIIEIKWTIKVPPTNHSKANKTLLCTLCKKYTSQQWHYKYNKLLANDYLRIDTKYTLYWEINAQLWRKIAYYNKLWNINYLFDAASYMLFI